MEWQIILALVLGIPVILLPIAFVWYLNISGLYQVIRDARQRQKRRAALEEKRGVAAKGHATLT
jgi:CHASE3 domain sensor protein